MKIDVPLRSVDLNRIGDDARAYEEMGFEAAWSYETAHDPFLPLLGAALATSRIELGTSIAVAFARSPFAMAQAAWDLQRASGGRLRLGLGTQVRAHVERRFSAEFEHPAARITDYIRCVRAIWHTFQTGERPAHEGPFYRFTLISDFFNPGPNDCGAPPISLAGVNERMCRAAGEVADGFHVHPLHSPGYVRDVVRPAIAEGARAAGRAPEAVDLITSVFVVGGDSEAERSVSERAAREQIAFYSSTPSYRRFLDYHGHAALGKELSVLARRGDFAGMADRVPDDLLEQVVVSAPAEGLAAAMRVRYPDGIMQRVYPYAPVPASDPGGRWRAFVRAFRSGG